MNPVESIQHHAAATPQKTAVVQGERRISYSELASDIESMAAAMAERGLASARGVAIVFDDDAGYLDLLALLALYRLQITSCSLAQQGWALHLPMLPPLGIDHALTVSVAVAESWGADAGLPLIDLSGWTARPPATPLPAPGAADFIARLQFSSGTTGKPKPILIPDSRYRRSLPRVNETVGLGKDDRVLLLFSFYVTAGAGGLLAAMALGATVYMPIDPEWDDIWNYVARHRISLVCAPPFVLSAYLDDCPPADEPGWPRRITLMGARCPLDVYEKAVKRMPDVEMVNLFGSTELGVVSSCALTRDSIRQGLVGTVQPFATVQIVDGSDQPLPVGSAGLLRARTDIMTTEYAGNPEATRACFRDGWFYTGDQAVLRHDGQLVVVERTNDIVNYGGRKLNLRAIDETALAFPGVQDACAFMYANPKGFDEPWIAVVADGALDMDGLFAAIESAGDTVVGALPVKAVPRNNGKPQRWTIAAAFVQQRAREQQQAQST